MQTCFMKAFPANKCKGFGYCLPYDYNNSYYNGVDYPQILSFKEYQEKLTELRKTLEKKIKDDEYYNEEDAKAEIDRYRKSLKKDFFSCCQKYIQSYDYHKTLSIIKSDSRVKMYSSDLIGWTTFEHIIDKDCIITIKTNFAYGSASYFFVNVTYKGIDILPYSDIVRYYKVNMVDFVRYTRQYIPERDNWHIALKFVEEINNLRVEDEQKFVQTWVMDEVNEMIRGLYNYNKIAYYYLDEFVKETKDKKNRSTDIQEITICNITNNEIERYDVFPSEMIIAFKVEKISSALLLLDKLAALQPIYDAVTEKIEEIKSLNRDIYKEIDPTVEKIHNEIDKSNEKLIDIENRLTDLENEIAPKKQELDQLEEKKKELLCGVPKYSSEWNNIIDEFEKEHSEYGTLKGQIEELEGKRKELNGEKIDVMKEIRYRQEFVNQLTKCRNRIVDSGIID